MLHKTISITKLPDEFLATKRPCEWVGASAVSGGREISDWMSGEGEGGRATTGEKGCPYGGKGNVAGEARLGMGLCRF